MKRPITESEELNFFKSEGNTVRNVHLDWLGDYARSGMAEGFKASADVIVNFTSGNLRHPDIYFHPVAFLYRHSIELQLKNLAYEAKKFFEDDKVNVPHGHKLQELWPTVREVLRRIWTQDDASELAIVDEAVAEFSRLDSNGQGFRYLEDKNGQKNLSEAPRIISLENLRAQMERVHSFLAGCEMGIRHLIEIRDDARSECCYW